MHSLIISLPLLLLQADALDDQEQLQRWLKFYAQAASAYQIVRVDGQQETPLVLHPTNLLQYTNAERERGQHGAVFVWTCQGRPEAIGTIWSIRHRTDPTKRRTAHELHSLSLSPLRSVHPEVTRLGNQGKMPQWRPVKAGIAFTQFARAPDPSPSATVRRAQMRTLARGFDAVLVDRQERDVALRLLPKPLFRYASEQADVVDGALFAMVNGTDPELFVMIETRNVNGRPHWHFAACRCTGRPLRLKLSGQTVWQCERAPTWDGKQPYFFCVGVTEHDADLADSTDE